MLDFQALYMMCMLGFVVIRGYHSMYVYQEHYVLQRMLKSRIQSLQEEMSWGTLLHCNKYAVAVTSHVVLFGKNALGPLGMPCFV